MSVNASQSSVWLQLLWGHFLSSHSLAADWFSSIMLERCHQFDQLCAEFKQDSTGSCLLSAHEVQQNQDVLEHSCWSGRPVGLWSERLSPDSAGVCDWSDDGSDLSGFVLLTSLRFCQVLFPLLRYRLQPSSAVNPVRSVGPVLWCWRLHSVSSGQAGDFWVFKAFWDEVKCFIFYSDSNMDVNTCERLSCSTFILPHRQPSGRTDTSNQTFSFHQQLKAESDSDD